MIDADGVVYDIDNSFEPLPFISKICVERTEAKHDFTTLTTARLSVGPSANRFAGRAVLIDAEFGGGLLSVRGYYDRGNPVRMDGAINSYVHILGITNGLRNNTPRSWANRYPVDILREVVAPYKLATEIDVFPSKIDFFSQANGESDWQLLTRLAERIGFSLVSEGVVIRMIDVLKEERRTYSANYETLVIPSARSLHNNVLMFQVKSTTTPDGADYKDVLTRGSDRLNQSFSFRPSYLIPMSGTAPEFVGQHSGTFNSMEQAEIDARRVLRQARWTNIAEVTCLGYRNMKPGRCVLINDRDGEYGGFWYVTDTCHTFDYMTQTTSTAASMCRDTTDLRTRQNAVRIDPLTYPTPRLSQGSWQSDRQWDKIIE